MGHISPLLFLAAGIVLLVALGFWKFWLAKRILKRWAKCNNYEILASEHCWWGKGPFFWTTTVGQVVYYVKLRTSDGQEKQGWVRCGGWLWGVATDEAVVRWDE